MTKKIVVMSAEDELSETTAPCEKESKKVKRSIEVCWCNNKKTKQKNDACCLVFFYHELLRFKNSKEYSEPSCWLN